MRSPFPGIAFPCLLAASLVAATPAGAALVINEILPDPPGSDAGHEFVEFLNTGPQPVDLEGIEFQFANGADGPVWSTRWRGGTGVVLAPGQRFLLVDRLWADTPAGDAAATLALQNGPDAVRLVRAGQVLDLLGYGALTDSLLAEGDPAPLTAGLALARRPDGQDTGSNRADFVAAVPTPGAPNFRDWSAVASELDLDPPAVPRPGGAVTVSVTLANDGLRAWPDTDVRLACGGDAGMVRLDGLAPGGSGRVAWVLHPGERGAWALAATLQPGPDADSLRLDLGRLQVGAGVLVLNEVLGAPALGQGEWCELLAAGDRTLDLGDWSLRDEDGDWRPLPPRPLAPGDLVVVAQDSAALAAWLQEVARRGGTAGCPPVEAGRRLVPLNGWPTLNNSPPGDRAFADRLLLADPDGTVVDWVVLGAPGGPDVAGRSLERTSLEPVHPTGLPWAACTAGPGSTPGCPNAVALAPGAGGTALELRPTVLDRAAGGVHAVFTVAAGTPRWRLRIFDLWGRSVRDFGGDAAGAGPRDLFWDGRDDAGAAVPPGGYVFALETWESGGGILCTRVLCAVR